MRASTLPHICLVTSADEHVRRCRNVCPLPQIRMSNSKLYKELLSQRGVAGVSSTQLNAMWARILSSLKALVQVRHTRLLSWTPAPSVAGTVQRAGSTRLKHHVVQRTHRYWASCLGVQLLVPPKGSASAGPCLHLHVPRLR